MVALSRSQHCYACSDIKANQCYQDIIANDPTTHGCMFVPAILGSDKTTVSVAMGHTEDWPVYLSIGNFHNSV